jgi:exopolyphosphatase/guanosine-5'-triphosphate,3'-diphosphate pyrophosphatase
VNWSPGVRAAIDVGSNSAHVLIARVGADPGLEVILDESVQLGLGVIVDREGHLPETALGTTVEAVAHYVGRARTLGAREIVLMGTEPLRRASNRSVLEARIRDQAGLQLQVITHEEEATLTLLGVSATRSIPEPLLVIDIGGGSTELILAAYGQDPVVGAIPVGSARLTTMLVRHDPPRVSEVHTLKRAAEAMFDSMPAGKPARAVVVGGTGTNLCRLLGRPVEGTLDRGSLSAAVEVIEGAPAETLAGRYGLKGSRVAQLAAGAAMLEAAMDRYRLDSIESSNASLREGAVVAVSRAGDRWLEDLPHLIGALGIGRG